MADVEGEQYEWRHEEEFDEVYHKKVSTDAKGVLKVAKDHFSTKTSDDPRLPLTIKGIEFIEYATKRLIEDGDKLQDRDPDRSRRRYDEAITVAHEAYEKTRNLSDRDLHKRARSLLREAKDHRQYVIDRDDAADA